jgi:circadian clock protein KaiC
MSATEENATRQSLPVTYGYDMKSTRALPTKMLPRAPTGITGLDEMIGGGLPQGRTTVLVGGPGSGKTVLALQFLVNGARHRGEAGIFVAFEEHPGRLIANAAGFGWKLQELQRQKLFFLDAQPLPDLIQSGSFDLSGMLAVLESKIKHMKARRIVFDALDIVLALLPDDASRRRQIYGLHAWLLSHELTALITLKAGNDGGDAHNNPPYGFMQFMVDCALILNHSVVLGVSQRNLRVQKFRGSSFDENEAPFLIGSNGFDVAVSSSLRRADAKASGGRVSSGISRLDTMLGGGYFRASSVLVTGFPGTAKTTLGGAFAEAACVRGERTLFISFDSDSEEVIRNLTSVSIRLERFVKSGHLRMISARTIAGSAETYLLRITTLAREHRARCLVIDPISALSKTGNELTAHSVADRLIDWSKAQRVTLMCTSLLDELPGQSQGGSLLRVSTLADTWIHLSYLVQAGERNRGLSIMKSRGTAHSNQVRELILSDAGVTLTDAYSAGGEVLMGTMRWEKELAERRAHEVTEMDGKLKRAMLDAEEAELEVRLKSLQVELSAKQVEKALLARTTESHKGELSQGRSRMRELRGADVTVRRRK